MKKKNRKAEHDIIRFWQGISRFPFEALRKTLLKCIVATALGYPVGYWITPDVINQLIQWSFPENIGKLHYFPP